MNFEESAQYISRRARELYSLAEWDHSELGGTLGRVEEQLESLARRYQEELGGTQLILARRRTAGAEFPQNLFWATLDPKKSGEMGDPASGGKRFWRRIQGPLTDKHIARYAGDYRNRARYYEYDAERLALNEAHASLANGQGRITKILLGRFLLRRAPESLASLASEVEERLLSPWVRSLAVPALYSVERIIFAEDEVRKLVMHYQQQPVHRDLKLSFLCEKGRTHPRIRWRHREHGWLDCLTDREMRRLGFPKPLRRAISQWEVPRRRLLRHLDAAISPFAKVRQITHSSLYKARRTLEDAIEPVQVELFPIDAPGPAVEGTILTAWSGAFGNPRAEIVRVSGP